MDRVILRNVFSLVLVQGATYLIPLITFPYLLRVLGAAEFGSLVFSQAVLAYAVLLTEYGFNLSATQKAAECRADPAALAGLFWTVLAAKVALATLGVLVMAALYGVGLLAIDWHLLLATSPLLLGSILLPQWLFQGLERMGWLSACQIASRALAVPAVFCFVRSSDDVWKAALISSGANALGAAAALVLVWRYRLIGIATTSVSAVVGQLRSSWNLFLSTASVSLYTTTNQILVGLIAGSTQLGYFAAADRIRMACTGLLQPLSSAVYPRVSSLMPTAPDEAYRLIRRSFYVQILITGLVFFILVLGAPWIVRTIMGPQYEAAIGILRWLAPLPALVAISNTLGVQTMLPLGMHRRFSRILLYSGLLNLTVLPPLVYFGAGEGAAGAALLTELVVVLAMAWSVRDPSINPFKQVNYAR